MTREDALARAASYEQAALAYQNMGKRDEMEQAIQNANRMYQIAQHGARMTRLALHPEPDAWPTLAKFDPAIEANDLIELDGEPLIYSAHQQNTYIEWHLRAAIVAYVLAGETRGECGGVRWRVLDEDETFSLRTQV